MVIALAIQTFGVARAADESSDFSREIRPVLVEHCGACHNPAEAKNRHNFLKSESATDVETRRTLWRSVATQLRNRTMPPGDGTLPEPDRLRVADWIETRLRTTGCTGDEYAGYVAPRRLNRREYRNTVRDLFGVELPIADLFAADESGGAGFDTNGETLYLPPMMIERYMDAAQEVVDRLIVSPPLDRVLLSHELTPPSPPPPAGKKPARKLSPGERLSTTITVFTEGRYALRVSAERPPVTPFTIEVQADGVTVGVLSYKVDSNGGATARTEHANLSRGAHTISIVNGSEPIDLYSLTVTEQREPPTPGELALHHRLLGIEAGQTPVAPRIAVKALLTKVLPGAYRQPVEPEEIDRILALYDRAAERGDPFEEALKYALKGVLISPRFLFRFEEPPRGEGLHALSSFEIASRLSYFLWSTSPDEELLRLAAEDQLQDPDTLVGQVDRMLDDPRSRAFAGSFMGQWLGTNEIGGRAVPLLTELQHFYTPAVAADLREQPELFFHYILTENRSVLDLLNAPYTFLTARLAKYYQVEDEVQGLGSSGFRRVDWPDDRRAGVLGLASVLAMTSHYHQASPVLRGAWVLETLLGTPVPPPPPDVPELPKAKKGESLPIREILEAHRASSACAACHNVMDPIGLALENFDWMGRWRDAEPDGSPVDASGSLPSGETFNGPVELRGVLMQRKEEFLRQLVRKVLGYAIGRGQQDGDQCTIEQISRRLASDGYQARTLIREIVRSTPFRNLQGEVQITHHAEPVKREPRRLLGTK